METKTETELQKPVEVVDEPLPKMTLKKPDVLPQVLYVRFEPVRGIELNLKGKTLLGVRPKYYHDEDVEKESHYCRLLGRNIEFSFAYPTIKTYKINDIEQFYDYMSTDSSMDSLKSACELTGTVVEDYRDSVVVMGNSGTRTVTYSNGVKKAGAFDSYMHMPTPRNKENFFTIKNAFTLYHD